MAHLYHLYGGAISLSNSISSFDDCLFDSNNVNSDGHNSHGGTIHFDKTSGTFKNCSFICTILLLNCVFILSYKILSFNTHIGIF